MCIVWQINTEMKWTIRKQVISAKRITNEFLGIPWKTRARNCHGDWHWVFVLSCAMWSCPPFLHSNKLMNFTLETTKNTSTAIPSKYICTQVIYLKKSLDKIKVMNPRRRSNVNPAIQQMKHSLTLTELTISKVIR